MGGRDPQVFKPLLDTSEHKIIGSSTRKWSQNWSPSTSKQGIESDISNAVLKPIPVLILKS